MIPAMFIAAVNLFWLNYSTTRVSIAGRGLASVKLYIDNQLIDLGNLRRGESRFMFLPKTGTALYTITFTEGNFVHTACEAEVEPTGQHVEASLAPEGASTCVVTDPMLSDLMILKFF